MAPSEQPRRLLAVELADIGDLILVTPALGVLREAFPDAQIDILTTAHAAPILNHTGLVDQVILFNKFAFDHPRDLLRPANLREGWRLARQLRSGQYDSVLIFHHLTTRFGALKYAMLSLATGAPRRIGLDNGKGWFLTDRVPDLGFGAKHQIDYWLELVSKLGATPKSPPRLKAGFSDSDLQWARDHLPAAKPGCLMAIHPGSGGYNLARRWEPEKFAVLANDYQDRGYSVVLVGGPDDGVDEVIQHMKQPPVNLVGKTTLNQLAAVFSLCDSYIGADSGLLHLYNAANPQGKAIGLFGPSNHLAWGKSEYSPAGYTVVRSGALCSPCSYVDHTVGLRNGCDARTCMKMITPEDILTATYSIPQPQPRIAPALYVLGVPVNALTFADLLDTLKLWIADKTGMARQICTVNPEFIMAAQSDVNFYNILNRVQLCIPDGVGLLWAAKRLGHVLPERVTGSDGVPMIAARAAREDWRLFLLGAAPGIADKAAAILRERNPGLQIVGTHSGSPAADEEDAIVEMINNAQADILFVAYGAPNQDKWIARNLPRLNVRVAMGVGGSLDFIAGVTQRAPVWMRRAGIEWLHRLIQQPWRWRRMLRLPMFMLAVLWRGSRGPRTAVTDTRVQ